MSVRYCGIDFGTSNSAVAHSVDNRVELIALEEGRCVIPTAIFFPSHGTAPVFGRAAQSAYVEGEAGRFMRALKSVLGQPLFHERTLIQKAYVSLSDVTAHFLRHLRKGAEAALGGEVTSAVVGRPVQFIDGDGEANQKAVDDLAASCRQAGLRHVEFQLEPIAAALAYESSLAGEETVLVVDLGGGTSDFSIVRVSPARARQADRSGDILANKGIRVGGTDFDRSLSLEAIMPLLGMGTAYGEKRLELPKAIYYDLSVWSRINHVYERKVVADWRRLGRQAHRGDLVERLLKVLDLRLGHRLVGAAEAAKIELSERTPARLDLGFVEIGLTSVATRRAFEACIGQQLERIVACMQGTVRDAGLGRDDIKTVFMTGGSSQLPAIRKRVARWLPGARIAVGDMLGSVGLGLGLDAERRFR